MYTNQWNFTLLPFNVCPRHKLAATPQTGGNTTNWWQHQNLVASLQQVVFSPHIPLVINQTNFLTNAIIWRQHHKLVAALNGGLFLLLPYVYSDFGKKLPTRPSNGLIFLEMVELTIFAVCC